MLFIIEYITFNHIVNMTHDENVYIYKLPGVAQW